MSPAWFWLKQMLQPGITVPSVTCSKDRKSQTQTDRDRHTEIDGMRERETEIAKVDRERLNLVL